MSEETKSAQPPAPEVGVIACTSEDISWADCAQPCPEEPPAVFYAARVAELEAEIEQERIRLAGCSVAALGYHTDCKQGDYGWSVSYGDILALRANRDALKAKLEKAVAVVEAAMQYEDAQTGAWHELADALTAFRTQSGQSIERVAGK